jgi:tetratricopeptide (TPR) repeat protein
LLCQRLVRFAQLSKEGLLMGSRSVVVNLCALTLAAGGMLSLSGCQSGGKGSVAGGQTGSSQQGSSQRASTAGLPPFAQTFEEKRYSEAYAQAAEVATTRRGSVQQQAALIAGLSAQAMNRNADAVKWLAPLRTSSDSVIAGQAHAAMGLIAQERGGHDEASQSLLIASQKLKGDEAARAALYAGDSLRTLGKANEAQEAYERAQQLVQTDSGLRMMIGDRLRGGSPKMVATRPSVPNLVGANTLPDRTNSEMLTVQIGAYAHESTAQLQVNRLAKRYNVRVVPILRDGKRLYAVRVGKFSSRSTADAIKKEIGGTAIVTGATGE